MLEKVKNRADAKVQHAGSPDGDLINLELRSLLGFLRRHLVFMVAVVIVCLSVGVAYLLTTPPKFTASASVIIDARRTSLVEGMTLSTSVIESELQVIRSRNVATQVVAALDLTNNPEFMQPPKDLFITQLRAARTAIATLWAPSNPPVRDPVVAAVSRLRESMAADRVGSSYVIEIRFTAHSPELAADIANTVASSYLEDQLGANVRATERAGDLLQHRVDELRLKASDADKAVQRFKADNLIISTGAGALLSEAQISELNTQLIEARSQLAQARARLNRVQTVNASGITEMVVDALDSVIINELRQRYILLAEQERIATKRFGVSHSAVVDLRLTMTEIEQSIEDELRRLEQVYKSEFEIANARAKALQKGLDDQIEHVARVMQAQVKLRELESTANSYRTLYDSFVERSIQSAYQQSLPIGAARIITRAVPPKNKSAPTGTIVIALSALLGVMLGASGALIREFALPVVRTKRQLEDITQLQCFGILPLIRRPRRSERLRTAKEWSERERHHAEIKLSMRTDDSRYSVVLEQPFSRFTETIRSVKVATSAVINRRPIKVIGIVSAIAQEGKSVVASNLSRHIAQTGKRTLLIDADLRNPSLTLALAPDVKVGLPDVLSEEVGYSDALFTDSLTGLDFLPAGPQGPMSDSSEVLSSANMDKLLGSCRGSYDNIIIDFSPVLLTVDAVAAAELTDCFILVVEWGKTPAKAVMEVSHNSSPVRQRLLGCVLNKVDLGVLSTYDEMREIYSEGYKAA